MCMQKVARAFPKRGSPLSVQDKSLPAKFTFRGTSQTHVTRATGPRLVCLITLIITPTPPHLRFNLTDPPTYCISNAQEVTSSLGTSQASAQASSLWPTMRPPQTLPLPRQLTPPPPPPPPPQPRLAGSIAWVWTLARPWRLPGNKWSRLLRYVIDGRGKQHYPPKAPGP